jgi:microtubule-associated protein-like 6
VYYAAAVGIVLSPRDNKQTFFTSHDDEITCLSIDPTGQYVATGQMGKHPYLCVWDTETCEQCAEVGAIPLPRAETKKMWEMSDHIEFFDGRQRSSTSERRYISFYEREICCCAFSADSSILVAIGLDNKHMLGAWDWHSGKLLGEAPARQGIRQVHDVVWVPTESEGLDFISHGKGHIKFWIYDELSGDSSPLSSKLGTYGDVEPPRVVTSVCFTRDAEPLSAGDNGVVYLWDGASAKCIQTFEAHTGPCNAIAMSFLTGQLYTGGADGMLCQWTPRQEGWTRTGEIDVCRQSTVRQEKHHPRKFAAKALLGQGSRDAVTNRQAKAKGGSIQKNSSPHSIHALAVNARGEVAVGTNHSCIFQLNMSTESRAGKKPNLIMAGHYGGAEGLAPHPFSAQGIFATAGLDGQLLVWAASTRELIGATTLPEPACAAAINPDGDSIAVGCADGTFTVLSLDGLNVLKQRKHVQQSINELKYSADGKLLAVASHENYVDLYTTDRDMYEHLVRCKGNSSFVDHLDWSADGKTIQTNSGSNEIVHFDADTGKAIRAKAGDVSDIDWHTWSCPLGFPVMGIFGEGTDATDVNAVHMTKDRRHVATVDDQGRLKLFNAPCVVDRAPFREYWGHSSHTKNVRFVCEDKYLVTVGGNDNTVLQWKVEGGERKRTGSTRGSAPPGGRR